MWGFKHNLCIEPTGTNSFVRTEVTNADHVVLADHDTWTHPGVVASPITKEVANIVANNFDQAHRSADLTLSGVSAPGQVGGFDYGSPPANAWLTKYLVANDTQWGVVWSANNDCNGPHDSIKAVYPYYAFIGSNFTNPAGDGFVHLIQRVDNWNYFVGGNYGKRLPYAMEGQAGDVNHWVPVTGLGSIAGPNAGAVIFVPWCWGNSGNVGVAPRKDWGDIPTCFLNPTGPNANFIVSAPMSVAAGGQFAYCSTTPSAKLMVAAVCDSR